MIVEGTSESSTFSRFLKSFPIFLPVSPLMIIWYFMVLIIILLDFAFTVVFICYKSEEAEYVLWHAILPITTIIMGADILISFNTSFIFNGRIILDRKQIAKNYVWSFYFLFDILAFTVSLIQIILRNIFEDEISALNFLIYIKVIKGAEFDKLIKRYVLKSITLILYYQMIKNLILLFLVCHTIGSFFFYIDVLMIESDWYDPQHRWVQGSYCYENIIDLPVGWQYVYSFYYAVVTLSGTAYGDLTPLNQTETAYTFGSVALPMIIYAYLFSVIYNAISERRKKSIEATKYKKMAKYYFKDLGIDRKLTNKLMNYLTYVYEKRISIDNDFLENLAPSLKKQYIKAIVEQDYDFSIFYPLCRPEFAIEDLKDTLYNLIEEQTLPDGYTISHRIQKIKLYFINRGEVNQIVEIKQRKFTKAIQERNFFMLQPFFTGLFSMPKNNWYEIKSFTICQVIDYNEFMNNVRILPALRESYSIVRDRIMFGEENTMFKTYCFFCDHKQHTLPSCPHLRPATNITELMQRNLKRNQLNRNQFFIRKQFYPKNTPIISGKKHKIYLKEHLQQNQRMNAFKQMLNENISNGTQTSSQGLSWKLKLTKAQNIDQIHSWKIFYPTFNC